MEAVLGFLHEQRDLACADDFSSYPSRVDGGCGSLLLKRLADDGQVRRAVELLQRSQSREDLFKLAGTPLPSGPQG